MTLVDDSLITRSPETREFRGTVPSTHRRASWHRALEPLYDRRSHRLPFQEPVCLIGLTSDLQIAAAPVIVQGRDISCDGISLTHPQPLPFRFVGLTIRTCNQLDTAVVQLSWCRYGMDGRYVSGGRFLHEHKHCFPAVTDWTGLNTQ